MKKLYEVMKVVVNVTLLGGNDYKDLDCVTID